MTPALVLQHGPYGPPGRLGEWAAARGIELEVHRADLDEPLPECGVHAFIVSLGSKHSPADVEVPAVAAELDFIAHAIDRDVPVLGLCYGGQVLATVLGGTIDAAPRPELGWHRVRTRRPEVVAEGPWLQWHYARFSLPPGAEEVARSAVGLQAFRHGRHLAVQFHPESTIEIAREWARLDPGPARWGIDNGRALVDAGRAHEPRAREAAFRLFDAFWARARA